MKTILIVTVMVLFFVVPVFANNVNIWTAQDTIMQMTYIGLQTIDTGQTLWLAGKPKNSGYYELNPILGRHPSKVAVIGYMVGTSALDTFIAYKLPRQVNILGMMVPARTLFQSLSIGLEAGTDIRNAALKIGVKF